MRGLIRIESCIQALATGEPLNRDDLQIDERLGKWLQAAKAEVKTPYIVPDSGAPSPKTKSKNKATEREPRVSTQEQTCHLIREGKTVLEVASIRKLNVGTIYGHITQLLEKGLLTEQEAGIDSRQLDELAPLFARWVTRRAEGHPRSPQGSSRLLRTTPLPHRLPTASDPPIEVSRSPLGQYTFFIIFDRRYT